MTGWEALRRLSILEGLAYVVQGGERRTHSPGAGAMRWETIAAFDCKAAADGYAAECRKTGARDEYRVRPVEPVEGAT